MPLTMKRIACVSTAWCALTSLWVESSNRNLRIWTKQERERKKTRAKKSYLTSYWPAVNLLEETHQTQGACKLGRIEGGKKKKRAGDSKCLMILIKIKRVECFVGSLAERLCRACASVAKKKQRKRGRVLSPWWRPTLKAPVMPL